MSVKQATVGEISWEQYFPGLILISALRLALRLRSLFLGASGLLSMLAGWWVLGRLFYGTDPVDDSSLRQLNATAVAWPWNWSMGRHSPIEEIDRAGGLLHEISPLRMAWSKIADPARAMFDVDVSAGGFAYLFLCVVWSAAVWALFGGMLARHAALALAREEQPSTGDLSRFVRQRWTSYVAAPMFPLVGVFLLAIPLACLGLLTRAGIGVLLAGLAWPLVLLAGLLMAILLIGLLLAWPLMTVSISAEGADSFGALSSSYAYVSQRPLRLLLYVVLAAVLGEFGWWIVQAVVYATLNLSHWGISWGNSWQELRPALTPDAGSWSERAGGGLVRFWEGCLMTLAAGFAFSYLWHAATAIYFLLRFHVDATEMDEVYVDDAGSPFGLPDLEQTSSAGGNSAAENGGKTATPSSGEG